MSLSTEKIQLLKINNRVGIFMPKKKYDRIVEIILHTLAIHQQATLTELLSACERYSTEIGTEGAWVMLQVKQDMEARSIIKVNYLADRIQCIELTKKAPQRSITGNNLKEKIFIL